MAVLQPDRGRSETLKQFGESRRPQQALVAQPLRQPITRTSERPILGARASRFCRWQRPPNENVSFILIRVEPDAGRIDQNLQDRVYLSLAWSFERERHSITALRVSGEEKGEKF